MFFLKNNWTKIRNIYSVWARCRLEGLDELPDDCDVEGPGLLGRGDDLVSGQNEPKATCVTNIKKCINKILYMLCYTYWSKI